MEFSARTESILQYLAAAETAETNPWFRDNYRQAWIALCTFARGQYRTFADAFVAASFFMYGLHPDKVWPAICARREAKLGAEYTLWYDAAGNLNPESLPAIAAVKKPPASERRIAPRKKAA